MSCHSHCQTKTFLGSQTFFSGTSTSSATIPSEVSNPVIQPATPYVGSIGGILRPGMRLHVEGNIHPNADRFQVNFTAGAKDGDDIAFHFNPRIGQNVTMNTFQNGQWMIEELGSDMPFVQGASFKLLFIVYKDFYEVHVNGMRLYTFNHRIPLERITTLSISGDVSIIWLGFEDWRQTFTYSIPSVVSNPVIHPSIPYVGPVAGGIRPGMQLHVEGAIPTNAKQFQINFKTGVQDGDDTAFHFNPRIGHNVHMNIFRNGQWQKEELGHNKPFVEGASFHLLFIIYRDFYEVHVNGEHIYKFNHRIPVDRVNTLGISGDVLIRWFGFATKSTPKPLTPPSSPLSLISLPLKITYPISNLRLPYVDKIPGGLKEDMVFFLQGTILTNATSIIVNFKTGPCDADDIAFHYRPWIDAKTVLNSFQNEGWRTEEDVYSVPYTSGGAFILLIAIKSDGYEVFLNGVQHCTFRHRIPLEKVSTVQICGNVATNVCGFIDNWSTHSSFAELKKVTESSTSILPFLPLETSYPIKFPAIPYASKIPNGLKPGMAMFVYGTVFAAAERFSVNFKTGKEEGNDIAFHYNPRFSGETVLNSFRNGGWETPENLPGLPFTRKTSFQIIFVFKSEGYEVYVDGSKHCTFKHRIPLETVYAIDIPGMPSGGVTIQFIGFVENWKKLSI